MRSPRLLVQTVFVVLFAAGSFPAVAQETADARTAQAAEHRGLLEVCRTIVNDLAAAAQFKARWDSLMPEVGRKQAWIEENRGLEARDPGLYAVQLERYNKGLEELLQLKKELQRVESAIRNRRVIMVSGTSERCAKLKATREELTAVCGGSKDAFCSAFHQ
jgi:hypothetical protein